MFLGTVPIKLNESMVVALRGSGGKARTRSGHTGHVDGGCRRTSVGQKALDLAILDPYIIGATLDGYERIAVRASYGTGANC
jgi:hypothetical protein